MRGRRPAVSTVSDGKGANQWTLYHYLCKRVVRIQVLVLVDELAFHEYDCRYALFLAELNESRKLETNRGEMQAVLCLSYAFNQRQTNAAIHFLPLFPEDRRPKSQNNRLFHVDLVSFSSMLKSQIKTSCLSFSSCPFFYPRRSPIPGRIGLTYMAVSMKSSGKVADMSPRRVSRSCGR